MYNKTKLLAMTASILMLASVGVIGSTPLGNASNGDKPTFASGDLDYFCYGNLKYLDTSRINACTEFGKAVTLWNNAVTDLDVQKTRALGLSEIDVSSSYQPGRTLAVMIVDEKTVDNTLEVDIKFNTKKKFGNGDYWHHRVYRYDFQTASLHELGHAFGLSHDSNSKIMKASMSTYTVERSIPPHDTSEVRGLFS